MIKIISFDLDGTLMDKRKFDDILWFEEIPQLYARKHGLELEEAKKKVIKTYYQHDQNKAEWYMPSFWFKHFDFDISSKKIMKDLQKRCELFPEVHEVLNRLKKSRKYKLIVLTHSTHEMNELKLEVEGLKKYFDEIISTISDLKLTKKSSEVYDILLKKFGVSKEEIVHIGDNFEFDYKMPRKMGIKAFFLDREEAKKDQKNRNRDNIVKDLLEFEREIVEK